MGMEQFAEIYRFLQNSATFPLKCIEESMAWSHHQTFILPIVWEKIMPMHVNGNGAVCCHLYISAKNHSILIEKCIDIILSHMEYYSIMTIMDNYIIMIMYVSQSNALWSCRLAIGTFLLMLFKTWVGTFCIYFWNFKYVDTNSFVHLELYFTTVLTV